MRNNHSSLFRYGLPVAVLGLGVLVLLPGSDTAPRASSVSSDDQRAIRAYLAAPNLVKQLDAMLAPAESSNVLVEEMSIPEPAISITEPSSTRELSALQKPASSSADSRPGEDMIPTSELRVGDQWLNMRAGPSTTTDVIRTLEPGAPLIMTGRHRGWVSVVTDSGESGWAYSSYLTGPALADTSERAPSTQVADEGVGRGEVTPGARRYAKVASDTFVREEPSQGTERLFIVSAGERVEVAEIRDGWARVVLRSGAAGWVRVR